MDGDAVCLAHGTKRDFPVIGIGHQLPYGFIKHSAGRAECHVAQKLFPDQLGDIGKSFGVKSGCHQLPF